MYNIKPDLWKSLFAVPSVVVDKHLKFAGAVQIKALLWITRHNGENFDEKDIAKAIGYSADDVRDALQYWIQSGVLGVDGVTVAEEIAEPEKTEEKPTKKKDTKALVYSQEQRPTNDQIAARCDESEEIKFLFNETQVKLGRTIGYDSMSNLLMLHDHYGLPVEVILMLVEYCKSVNKPSMAYITAVGRDWAEKEIDTLEKADEQIEALSQKNETWKQLCAVTGISNSVPTKTQLKYLDTWQNEWGMSIEMIQLAYEEMANHTAKLSFPYMNKVLQNWYENSITTPEAVEAEKQKRAETNSDSSDASYDIDEYMQKVLNTPLKYKKD
ncbi:MAG: DnaD domain protein [Clostridia bacterium]|nr:DnaD domain protein [Clostridia bacterium]